MATLHEYFDTDARALTVQGIWTFTKSDCPPIVEVIAKIAYDFEANAKYWYFYVPAVNDLTTCLSSMFASAEFAACRLEPEGDGVYVETGHSDYSERQSTRTLQFTKRVHLYLDFELTPANRRSLVDELLAKGYYLSIRDREYARRRSESERPLAFISHDSRDKDAFVRELARELIKNFCTVWYDEFSLKVGDSLRANIERGLKETRKCIVVLSPNFLANKGWGLAEFDSVFTREMFEQQNVILPVWLNVEAKDIYNYSPRLADKVGLPSSLGVVEVARRLANAVKEVA
ncbi:MAG: toll/interleukin-1 receptor domain-containing protein [Paludisphaera borealis]|uniref:toll/interleukin-1 receptor domain-containing protein n=1 Tax=Paludisphaera borealis TaxID=1387353 RepID=UPI00283EB441|nr:toll/interleukin-1 receptor domain-containing protein [Paludisphaera borealis]MDR3618696.1 toll/interleukin-1 receptor domain-containing protein [Paludisphaera borealis]